MRRHGIGRLAQVVLTSHVRGLAVLRHAHTSTRASAARGGARVGRHGGSKASARADAFQSPLMFDDAVRARERQAQREAQQGQAAPARLAFRSTRDHRMGPQESIRGSPAEPTPASLSPSPRGVGAHPREGDRSRRAGGREDGWPRPSPALVLPYSTFAYRSRLTGGRLVSLVDLVEAPYAPAPLQVLLDVLGEARRLAEVLDEHEGEPQAEEEAVGVAQGRLRAALARAQDVRDILSRVRRTAADVVAAADVVGDRDSMREWAATTDMLERFAEVILNTPHEGRSTAHAAVDSGRTSSYALPDAAYAEMLRGVLELCEVVGSPVKAVAALDALMDVSQTSAAVAASHAQARGGRDGERMREGSPTNGEASANETHNGAEEEEEGKEEEEDDQFSLDDAVMLVDRELQSELRPVAARDHLCAIRSCQRARDFDLALSLYRRFIHHAQLGAFAVTADDIAAALVALAGCSRTSVDFAELQRLLIESEAAEQVPVSVPLYTALIDAVSRALDNPQRMSIALALYRRLRDGQLTPSADTYAALIACCASTCDPTQAFAFYQEARLVCGVNAFTPPLYTNLLLAYVRGGYGQDARRTLDVLVEAGAPLTRPAFHAALAGAVTLREAQEVLDMMTDRYNIRPTPHTFAYLVQAAAREPRGATTALQLFDLHEAALRSLADLEPAAAPADPLVSPTGGQESRLAEQFPLYARAVEHALMRVRVDPARDPRMATHLRPLLRLAQQRMNAFTGMAPQAPTRIPSGAHACVAVLAADVLADLDTYVLPFAAHYSAIVLPYSALLALQQGGGRRVDGLTAKGPAAGLHDSVWADAGDERSAVVEHRRRRLARFLQTYKDVVHLVSLEEELTWARDTARYGIAAADWVARSAAFAINLARKDVPGGTKVYANHEEAAIVLVSTNYQGCGRYIVDLKKTHTHAEATGGRQGAGLREGLARVFYHNPKTHPTWSPLALSMRSGATADVASPEEGPTLSRRDTEPAVGGSGRGGHPRHVVPPRAWDDQASEHTQQQQQQPVHAVKDHLARPGPSAEAGEAALDAELLLSMMNETADDASREREGGRRA